MLILGDPLTHATSTVQLYATADTGSTANGSINWVSQALVPLATAALTFLGVVYQSRHQNTRKLKRIKEPVDLYDLLPEASSSRVELLKYIDGLVEEYVLSSKRYHRDWSGVALAGTFLGSGTWVAYLASYGGWLSTLWILAVVLFLAGLIGMSISLPKKDHEEQRAKRQRERELKDKRKGKGEAEADTDS